VAGNLCPTPHAHTHIHTQGIDVNLIAQTVDLGTKLNGSYTGTLGRIQRGELDTLATYTAMNLDRYTDFALTSPFQTSTSALLMRRPENNQFDYDVLTLSVTVDIMLLLAGSMCLLVIISWLNERRFRSIERNHIWSLFISRIYKRENGITGKLVRLTFNFIVFMLYTYYNSYLPSKLLLPTPPPQITVTDIANLIQNGKYQLIVSSKNSVTENFILTSTRGELFKLANALKTNPSMLGNISNVVDEMVAYERNSILLNGLITKNNKQ
jgi:hypothetical protein